MKKKNTPKVYLDVSKIKSLEDYYTQVAIVKAMVGSPQTKREITEFIERITTATIDSLFIGNTVAVYKNGRNLVRIPASALVQLNELTEKEAPKKKPGFLKRFWNWITGKKN